MKHNKRKISQEYEHGIQGIDSKVVSKLSKALKKRKIEKRDPKTKLPGTLMDKSQGANPPVPDQPPEPKAPAPPKLGKNEKLNKQSAGGQAPAGVSKPAPGTTKPKPSAAGASVSNLSRKKKKESETKLIKYMKGLKKKCDVPKGDNKKKA